jgi:DNA-binding YbaB/EbfC family protein
VSTPFDAGDLSGLLSAMQQLQSEFAAAEAGAAARQVQGSAGSGAVTVSVSGEFSFDKISIDPAVVDVEDLTVLEDLVLAAVRDSVNKLLEARKAAMGDALENALGGLLGSDVGLDEDDEDDVIESAELESTDELAGSADLAGPAALEGPEGFDRADAPSDLETEDSGPGAGDTPPEVAELEVDALDDDHLADPGEEPAPVVRVVRARHR